MFENTTVGITFLVAVSFVALVDSAKILMLCTPGYSHIAGYLTISHELITKYQHQITMVLPDFYPTKSIADRGVHVLQFKTLRDGDNKMQAAEKMISDAAMEHLDPYEFLKKTTPVFADISDAMLSDEKFMTGVKEQTFDIMVIETLILVRGNVILPHKFGIPFIAENTLYEPWITGTPGLPSNHPHTLTTFTPEMTFLERITNFIVHVKYNLTPFPYDSSWLLEKHLPHVKKSFRELISEAEFWIVSGAEPHMDYILPSTPNVAFVGGLTTVPAKPLPEDLQKFINNAEHGVIIMSFGSVANQIPNVIFEKFFDAFARIKQKVLVRTPTDYPGEIPSNVMAVKWLPQNDVLGHPKTKLFITHCGNAGQYEALYHAVPMLGVPFMPSDQPHNSKRIEYKGFGISVDFRTVTSNQIYENIQKILNEPSYAKNIKKASEGFKSAPLKPAERAAYWIDYIAKYGGDNLRPPAINMPLWKYLMLDVVATVFGISAFLFIFLLITCKFLFVTFKKSQNSTLHNEKKSQ